MAQWPEILTRAQITPSTLVFVVLFIIVLIYLFFFQQVVTAFFYKLAFRCFKRKHLSIKFERFSFSIITGQLSIHRIEIITKNMKVKIGRIRATLYYWRKIPTYLDDNGETSKCRMHMTINALDVTLFNRAFSTEMVEKINALFKEGKTTTEVTEFLKSQWQDPVPYALSLIYRAFLPFDFSIHSAAITIGNERLPSFCVFQMKDIYGGFMLKSRETPQSHIKTIATLNMEGVTLKVHPHTINYPPIYG